MFCNRFLGLGSTFPLWPYLDAVPGNRVRKGARQVHFEDSKKLLIRVVLSFVQAYNHVSRGNRTGLPHRNKQRLRQPLRIANESADPLEHLQACGSYRAILIAELRNLRVLVIKGFLDMCRKEVV